ncbi:hypothetical protein P7C70_g9035, partial [Phenoliferia sp. Uapishka_3]
MLRIGTLFCSLRGMSVPPFELLCIPCEIFATTDYPTVALSFEEVVYVLQKGLNGCLELAITIHVKRLKGMRKVPEAYKGVTMVYPLHCPAGVNPVLLLFVYALKRGVFRHFEKIEDITNFQFRDGMGDKFELFYKPGVGKKYFLNAFGYRPSGFELLEDEPLTASSLSSEMQSLATLGGFRDSMNLYQWRRFGMGAPNRADVTEADRRKLSGHTSDSSSFNKFYQNPTSQLDVVSLMRGGQEDRKKVESAGGLAKFVGHMPPGVSVAGRNECLELPEIKDLRHEQDTLRAKLIADFGSLRAAGEANAPLHAQWAAAGRILSEKLRKLLKAKYQHELSELMHARHAAAFSEKSIAIQALETPPSPSKKVLQPSSSLNLPPPLPIDNFSFETTLNDFLSNPSLIPDDILFLDSLNSSPEFAQVGFDSHVEIWAGYQFTGEGGAGLDGFLQTEGEGSEVDMEGEGDGFDFLNSAWFDGSGTEEGSFEEGFEAQEEDVEMAGWEEEA